MPSNDKNLQHDRQKSYAGEWGQKPRRQPPGAVEQAEQHTDPERPIAVPRANNEGEPDENLVGDRLPSRAQDPGPV